MSVNLTIDSVAVSAPENSTILEAAALAGIHIPSLCFLKECNNVAACRMCVVEVKGARNLMPACSVKVREGMEILTDSPAVQSSRRHSMDLIFRHHNVKCEYCSRYADCELHALLRRLGMDEHRYETGERSFPDDSTKAIVRDNTKCITCRRCVSVCQKTQGLGILKAMRSAGQTRIGTEGALKDTGCILCGACIQACPTGALSVHSEVQKVSFALRNKRGRKLVAVVSPESAENIGTFFFDAAKENRTGKLIAALRILGFDAVYDRNSAQERPFCPAAARYAAQHYPEIAEKLYPDAVRHPFADLRRRAAEQLGVKEENVYLISVTPCTSEKGESTVADAILTTTEMADLFRHQCVSRFTANQVWESLEPGSFDCLEKNGRIVQTRKFLGMKQVMEALKEIENGALDLEEVELWACPGGCQLGGGQQRQMRSGV